MFSVSFPILKPNVQLKVFNGRLHFISSRYIKGTMTITDNDNQQSLNPKAIQSVFFVCMASH